MNTNEQNLTGDCEDTPDPANPPTPQDTRKRSRAWVWSQRDWTADVWRVRREGHLRHLGDLCFQAGLTDRRLRSWRERHPEFKEATELGAWAVPKWHLIFFMRLIDAAALARFAVLRAQFIASGLCELEALQKSADTTIAEKRATRRKALPYDPERAREARRRGQLPRGWRGVQMRELVAKKEDRVRHVWGVVVGVARTFGISIDAAVAMHMNPETRSEAEAVVKTMRQRIAARRAKGETARDDSYTWPVEWRAEHLSVEMRQLAGEGPQPQRAAAKKKPSAGHAVRG